MPVRDHLLRLSRRARTIPSLLSGPRIAAAGGLVLGVAGSIVFARTMHGIFPIQTWLAWTVLQIWAWVLLFTLSNAVFGQFVLVRLLRLDELPPFESAFLSAILGTLAFTLAMYLVGALALYNRVTAIVLPVAFLAVGARDGLKLVARIRRELAAHPHGLLSGVIAAFGVLCVGLIYLGMLSPDTINYDSAWVHLRIAQDYARSGGIVRFTDYNAIVPHLASILYTWGYLVPGLDGPPRWMMALHLELSLVLWTLVGVGAGIQRLTENFTLKSAWAAFFLFPIIFVYDSNIGGAADHVAAFFAVGVLLAAVQLRNGFSRGRCLLLAAAFAGAALTKYQAIYLAVGLVPVVVLLWLRDWRRSVAVVEAGRQGPDVRAARRELLRAPAILIGASILFVSPHFIKNLVFYRNPVYPFLLNVFTGSTPNVPNAAVLTKNVFVDPGWVPRGTLGVRLSHAAELFFTFSFQPHYSFTRDVPAFGSLFTLLLPALLFVRGRTPIAIGAVIAAGAVFAWGMTYNVDRNLQMFMPIMVCVAGALVVKLWRLGWIARAGLIPLLALQIIWGADAPFYGDIHGNINSAMELIRSTFDGRGKHRFDGYRASFVALGKALPRHAKLLLHRSHLSLGIDRETVQDMAGFQGLVTYHAVHTPRELYDYFRSLGITHLTRTQDLWDSSRQEQILYDLFLARYSVPLGNFGGLPLNGMPAQAPPAEPPYRVLCLGLEGYADGLYPVGALNVNEHLDPKFRHYPAPEQPLRPDNEAELLRSADVVLAVGRDGDPVIAPVLGTQFDGIPTHGEARLYARRR